MIKMMGKKWGDLILLIAPKGIEILLICTMPFCFQLLLIAPKGIEITSTQI